MIAINKNIEKANKEHDEMMKKITGGIKLPGGF